MITFTWTCFQRSGSLSGNLSVWFCCVCPQKYSTCVFFCSPSGLSDGLRRWEGFKASSYFQSVFLSGHSWLSSPAGGEKKWERRKCQDLFAPSCLWCPLLLGVSSHGRRGQTMLLLSFIVCAWRTGDDRCSFMDGGLCVTTFPEQITQILEQKVSFNGDDVTLTLLDSKRELQHSANQLK